MIIFYWLKQESLYLCAISTYSSSTCIIEITFLYHLEAGRQNWRCKELKPFSKK